MKVVITFLIALFAIACSNTMKPLAPSPYHSLENSNGESNLVGGPEIPVVVPPGENPSVVNPTGNICFEGNRLDTKLLKEKEPAFFKAQYLFELFDDYASCRKFVDEKLQGIVCSDVFSATLTSCQKVKDSSLFLVELNFVIPVLIDGDKPVLPYNYFLNELKDCETSLTVISNLTEKAIPTAVSFTSNKTKTIASCLNQRTMKIQVLGL